MARYFIDKYPQVSGSRQEVEEYGHLRAPGPDCAQEYRQRVPRIP
jgi:hypothetical protein